MSCAASLELGGGSVSAPGDVSACSAVAIVGLAFRLPGDLSDEKALWEALRLGQDLVGEIPAERWAVDELQHSKRGEAGRSITFSAGVLSGVDEFDAGFFGISPREAAWLDPQQRLLLELAWEALENAGIPASRLAGSNCAVYVGMSSLDYGTRGLDDLASLSAHFMTGNTMSMVANRLSYVLDLHGPSLVVDTACSSSLVALHHACNSLRAGEASAALVGGVNLLLHPHPFVGFTKASMLSSGGRCKPFDASGDGYVRSEGGAVLVLKLLDRALEDGDEIHAVIRATGVNADGARKTGITIPSSAGQAELMRAVLVRSGLIADEVDFIEAHGTGTAVGDPVEASAIGEVYGRFRATPLPIGSIKGNLGHLEAASGMAGLIKAILALKNRALPPAMHLVRPNPHIDFKGLNLQLVTEYRELESDPDKALIAGVNSFGFGGANSHVLLQEFRPSRAAGDSPDAVNCPPLFISARGDGALRELAGRYAALICAGLPESYYDIARAAAFQRDRLDLRLAISAADARSVASGLTRFASGENPQEVIVEEVLTEAGGIAFVYSGNGAQWVGMGRALFAGSHRFKEILIELDERMRTVAGFSLQEELQAEASRMDDTVVAQPLLFAIQVAVTLMLRDAGVRPAAVCGHSVGEVAAAWAAGGLSLEQAIRVICARSQAQGLTRGSGRMAAVGMSASALLAVLAEMNGADVELAGINSPNNVTVSGALTDLLRLKEVLQARKVFFRLLDLDYAFHSRQMDPAEAHLASALAGLTPCAAGGAVYVSSVTGQVCDGTFLGPDYWWRNVREPVRFADAIASLAEQGCRVFMEIGPHAILQRYVAECLDAVKCVGRVMPTLRRNDDGPERVSEAALRALLLCPQPDLALLFPWSGRKVRLPGYPWQREKYWHPQTSEGLRAIGRRRVHPLLGWHLPEAELAWENVVDPSLLPWLADHKVGGVVVFPGTAYLEMALAASREWHSGDLQVVEQLDIIAPMVFDGEHARSIRFIINARDGSFQIRSRQRLSADEWVLHAAGRLLEATDLSQAPRIGPPAEGARVVDRDTHYIMAEGLGLGYGPAFRGLVEARTDGTWLEADVSAPDGLAAEGFLLHPALMDLCFQSVVDFFQDAIGDGEGIAFLPIKLGRVDFLGGRHVERFRAHLKRGSRRSVVVDFEVLDACGGLVARAHDCRFRAAPLKRQERGAAAEWRTRRVVRPHPADQLISWVPRVTEMSGCLSAALVSRAPERERWFRETLPLVEALALAFAYQALRRLVSERADDWQAIGSVPHGRWLMQLLEQEGLLTWEGNRRVLVEDPGLPVADELWRVLLQDAPVCLSQLALMARAASRLDEVLLGRLDGAALACSLRTSPFAEARFDDDPAYLGTRLSVEALLHELGARIPEGRRLRVLEFPAGPSELPKLIAGALRRGAADYVLAVQDEESQTRHLAEFHEQPGVVVARLEEDDWHPTNGGELPAAFDLIILRHCAHRARDPRALLAQAFKRLACGGVVVLAERHPDWSANFIEGLDPAWWGAEDDSAPADAPRSALVAPAAWRLVLEEAGFTDCEVFSEDAAGDLAAGAYLVLAARPEGVPVAPPAPAPATWYLLADSASEGPAGKLADRLTSALQKVDVVSGEACRVPQGVDHVVWMRGWGEEAGSLDRSLADLLQMVQAIGCEATRPPRLWCVTRGAAPLVELPADGVPSPWQTALWGFGRVVMNEYPGLTCTLINVGQSLDGDDVPARLALELLWPDGADEVLLTAGARHVPLLEARAMESVGAAPVGARHRLDFHGPGQLRNLVWLPEEEGGLGDLDVEVQTRATGLNFRDVMYLMGLLPDEAVEKGFAGASLGLEFAGVVSRVGAAVHELRVGDAVMGFGPSCFASHVVTRADAVARMPEDWSFEAAATVPTVFLTVYYALCHLADLQPGERVLIHGAAGGVGIAAIQLARHVGAEVFATAGSEEKRDFVRLLGADHVFDSRGLAFADEILAVTGGEGVDVVLNSLAGEAMRRSLDVLRPFGRFLELGKRDFFENTPLGLRPFKSNISYFGIDADQLLTGRPRLAARLFDELITLFRKGTLSPLPYRTFNTDRVVDAFRVMQQARHIGKIVVKHAESHSAMEDDLPPRAEAALHGTWLVTGGLSGFGLASARRLADLGAGGLVLVGRRGMATPGAADVVAALEAHGVRVRVEACDVSDGAAVAALIARVAEGMPPLTGVLHAAAAFDDGLIANLDPARLHAVLAPKLLGAWHLHQVTRQLPIEHFVLYSSVTTAIGNPGQANYVAANAGLEGLVALRQHQGLPACCIVWGPIGDVGYLERNIAVKDGLAQRLGRPPTPSAKALEVLGRLLARPSGVFTVADFDWNVLARLLPSSGGCRFAGLNGRRSEQAQEGESGDIRAQLAGRTPAEGAELVRGLVAQEVAQILSVNVDRIEPHRSLHELGMDSLMAVELAVGLEQRFGIQLPVMMLNDAPTVDKVAQRIVEKLAGGDLQAQPDTVDQLVEGVVMLHGEDMSREELQGLVDETRELNRQGTRTTE